MSKLVFIVGAVATLTAVSAPGSAVTLAPSRSVWDSVYTDSQAVRGDSVYKESCVKCHGATLAGGDDGTPLAGDAFLGAWSGLPVSELSEKIRTTMPPDKPKSIGGPQLAAVVAYMLAQNHFPAGAKPLPDDVDVLKDIKILQSKP